MFKIRLPQGDEAERLSRKFNLNKRNLEKAARSIQLVRMGIALCSVPAAPYQAYRYFFEFAETQAQPFWVKTVNMFGMYIIAANAFRWEATRRNYNAGRLHRDLVVVKKAIKDGRKPEKPLTPYIRRDDPRRQGRGLRR